MINTIPITRFAKISTLALLAGACSLSPVQLRAADSNETTDKPALAQKSFATPTEAVNALRDASEAKDKAALGEIFGPHYSELATGDATQDAANSAKFAAAMAQGCNSTNEGDDKIILEVGTNNWPMPIPLVRTGGLWHFDTAAGKEEIINRHIGKDELHAIGVCRAYVTAQKQFATNPRTGAGEIIYARKFMSAPGKHDGLYWKSADNEPASPFGPLVAQAHADGYVSHEGAGRHPFHGYYFKILTRQGEAAPGGKMDYISHGQLTEGFALLAYPEHWDQSGVMSFLVNHDGNIFECNLGEKTGRIAGAMKEYNPDGAWSPVQEQGVQAAVSEK